MDAWKIVFCIVFFALVIVWACICTIVHNHGRTADDPGDGIKEAERTAAEIDRTVGDLADSIDRSGEVIADIRNQKLED